MERTVPRTATEEIELYLRTVYSLLRSTTEVQIRSLEEVHAGMNSLLHPAARQQAPDLSAFIYSMLRLPDVLLQVRSIILGQTADVFSQAGYPGIESWTPVSARARRRRCFFNGTDTLACFIASRSDIDDVIPAATAYQIEWNKLNLLLKAVPPELIDQAGNGDPNAFTSLAQELLMSPEDLLRLKTIWGSEFAASLKHISEKRCEFRVRLLGGSLSEYWRATRAWWENIEQVFPALLHRPVYFVSSNTHSIVNLLTGYAIGQQEDLIRYLQDSGDTELLTEWNGIHAGDVQSSMENFLYYVLKRYQQSSPGFDQILSEHEKQHGITRIRSEHSFDVEAQVYEIAALKPETFDPRLGSDLAFLQESNALILNIDYPLGLAAYNILTKVAEHANPILGVYVMGKAATLNGVLGDVMIPKVVHDEHSQNTYIFNNCFSASEISPFLTYGTVLDNQKALSVMGTFLQNAQYMDVFYREGFTDIEMESGSFLSAIYEMVRPKRHPINEIVNLYEASFEVGILHYASDTPLSKGRNLGAGTLSYMGMDSTYATSLAILKRIFLAERKRLGK